MTRRNPLLQDESYQYDLNGNRTQVTDHKGQVTAYTYDALNRLTQITYADSSTSTFTYNAANRITQAVDSVAGAISYTYDNLDRVTSQTTPQGTVSYTYDAAGRRTSMTVTGQSTINYSYDNANRLTQITRGSSTVTFAYDAIGRRISLTLPNGVVTHYTYDNASRSTAITYQHNSVTLGNLSYEYDAVGRRTKVGGSYARTSLPQPFASSTHNARNQLTQRGTQTFTYDANGNLLSDGVTTYTWNPRDQLAATSSTTDFKFYNTGIAGRDQDLKVLSQRATELRLRSRNEPVSSSFLAHQVEFSELGRFLVTRAEKDIGAFKTSSLRDVELTGPYMHNGSLRTLLDVVRFYNEGGHKNPNLDAKMRSLNLSESEMSEIVEFLRALTSDDVLRRAQSSKPQTRAAVPLTPRDYACLAHHFAFVSIVDDEYETPSIKCRLFCRKTVHSTSTSTRIAVDRF